MRSKSPSRMSLVSDETVGKRLILGPLHGRGREFKSHQVHQKLRLGSRLSTPFTSARLRLRPYRK